jgi:acyl-CoA thioester hydrolase
VSCAVRYADLDPNQHVNHARFIGYVEECRLAMRRHLDALFGVDAMWPVGGLAIRYLAALNYPGSVDVETAPIAVGRSSFTLGYGVYADGRCAAVAESQTICVDLQSQRSRPMPQALKAHLESLLETA